MGPYDLALRLLRPQGSSTAAILRTIRGVTKRRLAKTFFLRYNETNTDCVFVIDEEAKTVTATEYQELPVLFCDWSGSRNRPYRRHRR